MNQPLWDVLVQQLSRLGDSVGFKFEGTADSITGTHPPSGTLLWLSSFAVIAVAPISASTLEGIVSTTEAAREWLWRRLVFDEQKAKFLDGYLIIALPVKPDTDLRGAISDIELDSVVCRKHVIWPTKEGDWSERLWSVTCLGLPNVSHVLVPDSIVMPTLPDTANRSLTYYEIHKNYEAAADKLREEARLAAAKGSSNAS
jgi:hypothetical protein